MELKFPYMIMAACAYCGRPSWKLIRSEKDIEKLHFCKRTVCEVRTKNVDRSIRKKARESGVSIIVMVKLMRSAVPKKKQKEAPPQMSAEQKRQAEINNEYRLALRRHYGLGG